MDFGTELLGESRIRGIVQHIREQVESKNEFTDVRQNHAFSETDGKPLPPSKAIINMQHEVAYLKQEIEFIKKLSLRTGRQSGNAHQSQCRNQVRHYSRNDLP